MINFYAVTIHPQFIESYLKLGVLRAAQEKNILQCHVLNLRDFAVDKHGSIDDHPYGGGEGMVMRAEPLSSAVESIPLPRKVILTSPLGVVWDHKLAEDTSLKIQHEWRDVNFVFICGRFSGMDQRFIDQFVDEEWSLGNFILSGGEIPALAMMDSLVRLIPGVLGNEQSSKLDSFSSAFQGKMEYPLYTRPEEFRGVKVPEELMSGNHRLIEEWRRRNLK